MNNSAPISFRAQPDSYRHWRLEVDGPVATLAMQVDEAGGLRPGYELKLNSYDLAVDIELADAVQRLRFEHPGVRTVVLTSARERLFCAGANIRMLGQSSHAHKVNFCKFTNETRLAMEDASAHSGQRYLCAINGPAAGGGYELALACDHIALVDDGNTSVSLPELPLLAVLPGTGGLTRLSDKRRVRRDRADFFCTTEEGIRGQRALDWRLVDEVVPASRFADAVRERALAMANLSDRPRDAAGVRLDELERQLDDDSIRYPHVEAHIDRRTRAAHITVHGPAEPAPTDLHGAQAQGCALWLLALARQLDELLLHLRFNEDQIGTWVISSQGDIDSVIAYDNLLYAAGNDWFGREVRLYWRRLLKRLELSARSIITLVTPGSCFAGSLLEFVLAADRSYMLDGESEDFDGLAPATVHLTDANFGPLASVNGLARLAAREPDYAMDRARRAHNQSLDAAAASELGLVTFTPDDIDWQDEVRFALEERASFSPDALTGLEASLRVPGPETMESKIFGRLSAWQNWIFQRPSATGEEGALARYGTGAKGKFTNSRV